MTDARRADRAQRRTDRAQHGRGAGRLLSAAAGRLGALRGRAIERLRASRDERRAKALEGRRARVRRAPARRRAMWALWVSAARMHARRLVAAALGGALGVVGLVSTPLGRKLRWKAIQYPGRRLHHFLLRRGLEAKAARDAAIRARRAAEEADLDAAAERHGTEIGDAVARPVSRVPAATHVPLISEGVHVSGFRFEEAAAEMEQAAQSYTPDGCMEILAMVEGLPQALICVANVMKILAERADGEFPLEKEVAGSFDDMYGAVMSAVAVAEDMGPLFRQVHAQDIARHEDPRNGAEAEKGWNV
ncbi:hypothetical protein [Streptomyces sp. SCSIO ZS0520]|uniref:hypothetical protein n=1 Tax=Streptomyces sp. SCSIO ZS0520 TaxID=2892996 RepID=UPI0021DA9B94|nr:hypothetical protein [Streptomyces sp. SCSIO ZS0520]